MTFGTRRPFDPELEAGLEEERADPAPQENLERVWGRVERSIAGLPDGPKPSRDARASQDAPGPNRASLRRGGGATIFGAATRRAVALYLGGVLTGVPLGTLIHTRVLSRTARDVSPSPIVARLGSSVAAADASEPAPPSPPATRESSNESSGGEALTPSANSSVPSAIGSDSGTGDPGGRRGSGASTLAQERLLLDKARRALERDDARDALRWTELHKGRFAHPELGEEREAIAIQALAAEGQYDEARRRAARFLSATPNSLFRPVVETTVASIP